MFKKHNFLLVSLLFILSLPAVYALLQQGFFVSDDGEWMIIRFSAFFQALSDGQFPVRFLHRLNFGYGYPVATFLYPGFMYFATPIHLMGFSFINTIKIVLGLSLVLSSIFSFFWLRHIFKPLPSILGALFYLYTPYHLYDVYKRGSVGEVFALMFVPFVLWNIERRSFFWSALGIGGLILAHNSLALLLLPVLFVYTYIRKRFCRSNLFSVFFLGLFTASFFILPAVVELRYTKFSNIQISSPSEHFANLSLVGVSTIMIFIVSGVVFFKEKQKNRAVFLFLTVGFVSIFLSTTLSKFFWSIIPSSFVQFPFRFLSVVIICTSFLTAFLATRMQGWLRVAFVAMSTGLLIFSSYSYIQPKEFSNKSDEMYATNEDTTTVKNEYMPIWVEQNPSSHFNKKVEPVNGKAEIKDVVFDNKNISFSVISKENNDIKVNTVYWPGWKIKGKDVERSEDGMIIIPNVTGEQTINLTFQDTSFRLFSDLLTISSLGAILFVSLFKYKKLEK